MAIRELFDNSLNGWDFDSDLTQHPAFKNYDYNHTDLPKLRKGQVGGQVTFILTYENHIIIFTINKLRYTYLWA